MSASDDASRTDVVEHREGLLIDDVQHRQELSVPSNGGGGPPRPPRDGDGDRRPDKDWRYNFRALSAILGSQFVSGDLLYLVASELEHQIGEEAANEFRMCVTAGRLPNKHVHDFMG